MDICPAPGMKNSDADVLVAKATAANIRSQLIELGFDPTIYDNTISEVESLLVSQDIINLAKATIDTRDSMQLSMPLRVK